MVCTEGKSNQQTVAFMYEGRSKGAVRVYICRFVC
jgi:hypothetical protein